MKLKELIQSAPGASLRPVGGPAHDGDGASQIHGAEDIEIACVTEDSRRVRPGALFVARPGSKGDGADFVADAIARGAVAIAALPSVVERCRDRDARVRWYTCDAPARTAAHLAHAVVGWPSRAMKVAAVTGTNGKTTVSTLLRQLLEASGMRCGLIGTVEVHDGRTSVPASLTTPAAEDIARALRSMADNGCRAASMETSSHALHQDRTAGIDFSVGIFTNLTGDHLDYHGTMDAYAAAKAKLFDDLSPDATAIVNAMDPAHERIARHCRAPIFRCATMQDETAQAGSARSARSEGSARSSSFDAIAIVHQATLAGASITFQGPWGSFRAELPLTGRHNAMNALQAIVAAHAMGVAADTLESAVGRLRAPPGRLEPVTPADAPFQVLVDYAHTDDALANVLASVRPMVAAPARVIVVFGCGGDRDATKRPRMASTACRGADLVFVTSDNPRTEDPESIIEQIMTGVGDDARSRVRREVDRARAIQGAIAEARPGDVVVIAGKGHEDYQIVGTTKRHFDDREVARSAIEALSAECAP